MSSLKIGDVVERYVIEAILGTGGVATVYLVRHRQLGSLHALKSLHLDHPKLRERMIQEGKLQATLKHPNIVNVNDVLDINDAPGLLMEYISGGSLEELIDYEEISIGRAEEIFKGVVLGVKHAHDRGMIHRDLKPGNILITEDGIPKISDFGIARVLSERTNRNTMQGIALGTPQYMAPEQMRDAASVDNRADIFSLGVILYELLCNETPYKGADPMSTMAAITSGMYKPIEEVRDGVPKYLRRVVEACLEPSRHQRPASCELLLSMLNQGVRHLTAMSTLQTEEVEDAEAYDWTSPDEAEEKNKDVEKSISVSDSAISTTEEEPENLKAPPSKDSPNKESVPRLQHRSTLWYLTLILPAFLAFLGFTEEIEGPIQYGILNQIHEPPEEGENVVLMTLQPDANMRSLRELHAQMIRDLVDHHPSAIVFDLNFTSSSEYDQKLAESIKYATESGVPVILPIRIVEEKALWFSSAGLGEYSTVGVVETNRDFDAGWVRRAPVYKDTLNKGRLWHVSTLAANAHMKSRGPPDLKENVLHVGSLRVPIFRKYLYIGAVGMPAKIPYEKDSNLSLVEGKVVVVGVTHGIDVHATPFGPMYGAEVVSLFIETQLAQKAPRPIAPEINAILALMTGLLIAWLRQMLPKARQWFALVGLVGVSMIVLLLFLNSFIVLIVPVLISAILGWWLEKPYRG
jgi:serine/threonine protein kinase